jgi:undecaprenyl phosphate-alpha-L-ara4N flippase subunit ArnF
MAMLSKRGAVALVSSSVVLVSIAQIVFKIAMSPSGTYPGPDLSNVTALIAANWLPLAAGAALYGLSMILWTTSLTRLPVTLAYPLLSVSYVIVYALAITLPILDESYSHGDVVGLGLIVSGVVLVSADLRAHGPESHS